MKLTIKLLTLILLVAILPVPMKAMKEPVVPQQLKPKVVFLQGPVSTGKSSLCQALLKLDNTWKMVSDDDLYFEQTAICWQEDFPNEFAMIEAAIESCNINHAVMRNQTLFRAVASEEQRSQAKQAIAKIQHNLNNRWNHKLGGAIVQRIMNLARNHNVIVDAWFLSPDQIKQIAKEYDVIQVAAYCSFLEVIKRTLKRNCDALINGTDISNVRYMQQACNSFLHNYDFSNSPNGSITFEEKATVIHAFDLISFGLQDPPARGEFSPKELEQCKQRLIAKFATEKAHVVYKHKVDAVLRTDQMSPAENAQAIIKLALKKNQQAPEPTRLDLMGRADQGGINNNVSGGQQISSRQLALQAALDRQRRAELGASKNNPDSEQTSARQVQEGMDIATQELISRMLEEDGI